MDRAGRRVDVFVSHAGKDLAWAEWAAWQLQEAGYRVELADWDWPAGTDMMLRLSQALDRAERVLALVSESYLETGTDTRGAWTALLAGADGDSARLVPAYLEPLPDERIPALLRPLRSCRLHDLDEDAAVRALNDALAWPRRPQAAPGFPGSAPRAAVHHDSGSAPRLPVASPGTWQAPGRNPHFVGRDGVMAELRTTLRDNPGAVVVQALHGFSGIGKTQLAIEYVHRFASQYDTVWWVDAEQPDLIPTQLADLGTALLGTPPAADLTRAARSALEALRHRTGWLLVMDNAEDPDHVSRWLPAAGSGHVLITSRHPDWTDTATPLGVSVLSRAESVALLRGRVPELDVGQADGLSDDLGDLPLALAQAAGTLRTGMPVATYRDLLAGDAAHILDTGRPRSYPVTLSAAIGIGMARLRSTRPAAASLLLLCAFLAPEPVPATWFTGARGALTTLGVKATQDPLWPWSSLSDLTGLGLAVSDARGVTVHRLTQAVLRDGTAPDHADLVHADLAALLTANDPGDPDAPATWPRWARLLPHLAAITGAVLHEPSLRGLACRAARYLLVSGQAAAAREFTDGLHHRWTAVLGPDHEDTQVLGLHLGHAMHMLGHHRQAKEVNEAILERRRVLLGADDPGTLAAAQALAACLRPLGLHEQAAELDRHTLQVRRLLFGEDHPSTLVSAHDLAAGLRPLGRYEEARSLCEDTRERCLRVLGPDHPLTLVSAHDLAATLRGLKDFEGSRRLDEETLERRRRVLGVDHPHTLYSANGLAASLRGLGDFAGACRLDEETLERRRRVLGVDHPHTLYSANGLAASLRGLGDFTGARRLDEETLERRRRVLGVDHPHTLYSANGLAASLRGLGDFTGARRLDEETLERRRRVLGADHPHTLYSRYGLAASLRGLEDSERPASEQLASAQPASASGEPVESADEPSPGG